MSEKTAKPEESPNRFFNDLMAGFAELSEWARGERELKVATLSSDESVAPAGIGKAGEGDKPMPATAKDVFEALDEVGERAEAFYETNLRADLETEENLGKLLLIDTETNRYVIGDDRRKLAHQLNSAHPEAVYIIRIGYPAVTAIGNRLKPFRDMTPEEAASWRDPVRRSKATQ